MPVQRQERSYSVAAAEKALRVLDAFVTPPHQFTLTEVAHLAKVSTNQAFRLLQTLVGARYVVQEPVTRSYRLGPRLFGLVGALYSADPLLSAASDALTWAHRQTGETIAFFETDGEDIVCLDVRESDHPLLIAGSIGSRENTLHAGAVGKLVLSFQSEEAVNDYLHRRSPLETFTSRTPSTPEAVLAEIRTIRERGYSVSEEEIADGMYGTAAPVFDRTGRFAAIVNLSAPISRASPDLRDRHRDVMVEAARRISSHLGYRQLQRGGISA